jgi:DNA-damage-inducible protein J
LFISEYNRVNCLRNELALIPTCTGRVGIDATTKERTTDALAAMGLSIWDALLMMCIADEKRLLFEIRVPSATTRKALAELESGKGKHFASVDALMADLPAND